MIAEPDSQSTRAATLLTYALHDQHKFLSRLFEAYNLPWPASLDHSPTAPQARSSLTPTTTQSTSSAPTPTMSRWWWAS